MSAARTLFVLHYRRLLVPLVVLAASFYVLAVAAVAASARAGHPLSNDTAFSVDVMLLFVLFIFALPAGTAPFSRALKKQQILFFHTLPVPRATQWLALSGSSLAALATTVGLVALVRPGVGAMLLQRPTFLVVVGMLLTFAAGAAFSLVFVQPLAVYISAYAATLTAAAIAAYVGIAPLMSVSALTELRASSGMVLRTSFDNTVIATLALLLTVLLLVLSMLFYRRGELAILRTQLRNLAVAFGAVVAFAIVVPPLAVAALTAGGPMTTVDVAASPDGRMVVALDRSPRAAWRWEQRIVDTATGAVTTRQTGPISPALRWTRRGEYVSVARSVSRIPFRKRVTHLELVTADGRVTAAADFPGEDVVSVDASSEPLTIMTTDGANGRIVQWDRRNVRELVRAPFASGRADGGIAIATGTAARAWRITGGTATPLPFAGWSDHDAIVVNGVLYAPRAAAVARLTASAPLPRTGQPSWLLTPTAAYVATDDTLFHLEGTEWRPVGTGLPVWSSVTPMRERYDVDASPDGVAAFVSGTMLRLFDPATARTIDVGPVPSGRGKVLWRNASLLRCLTTTGVADYRYENGRVTPIPRGPGSPVAIRPDGSQVRLQAPSTVVVTTPDGRVLRRIAL